MRYKFFSVVLIVLAAMCCGCAHNEQNDGVPEMYALLPDGTSLRLVQCEEPNRYEYGTEHTMSVKDQAVFTLSTKQDSIEKGYLNAVRYTIWNPDGSVYDDGRRELFSSLSLNLRTDEEGNAVFSAPFVRGAYICGIEFEFERGTAEYGFKLIVSFTQYPEAEELVRGHYPAAKDVRYNGMNDIITGGGTISAYVFEVDNDADEKIMCAVSYNDGVLYVFRGGTWRMYGPKDGMYHALVTDVTGLADAIADDTCVTLAEGVYDLSEINPLGSRVSGLRLSYVNRLVIQAAEDAEVEICTPDLFSLVFSLN